MDRDLAAFLAFVVIVATSARLWNRVGWFGLAHVWPLCAEVASRCMRLRPGTRWLPRALVLRAYAASDRGDTARAVALTDTMLEVARRARPDVCDWSLVNAAVDIYVNGGRYRKALAAAEPWAADAQERGRAEAPLLHALAMINTAEALHAVGQPDAALRLLAETEPQANLAVLYSREGLVLLRAWILAHVDRARDAWTQLLTVDPRALGHRYRAEVHFARAVTLCALGDLEAAEREAREGAARARRAASHRNALQVEARVALAARDDARAIELLERARRHVYQGQAAPGLVLLGDAYARAGNAAEARRAYADALALDPESDACVAARARLSSS